LASENFYLFQVIEAYREGDNYGSIEQEMHTSPSTSGEALA
jgi:hypothetical protein